MLSFYYIYPLRTIVYCLQSAYETVDMLWSFTYRIDVLTLNAYFCSSVYEIDPLQKSNQLLVAWYYGRFIGEESQKYISRVDSSCGRVYTTLRTDDTDCHLLVVVQWFCQLNRSCCKLLQQTNSILIARVQREDPNMKGIVGWISTEKPKRVICEIDFIWSKLILQNK
jgi:hypothetical protein